ncbi:MAG: glycosyltransferase [Candidatus Aenigmatarchaeota archaeon]
MKGKTKVLPLPFDEEELKKHIPDPNFESYLLSLAKNRKIVLYVGRLVYYKGIEVLISAVPFLPENIIIFIVGDGPLKNPLKKKIKKLKLKDRVFLLGKLSNSKLASCYRICNIFCLPSLYKTEAFGLVQLEAMSFGKPIVSTKLPASGVCEVNIDGETGLCVEPGKPEQLAKAILEILENETLYLKMSQNAQKRVKLFHKKNIVSKLISFYYDLVRGG